MERPGHEAATARPMQDREGPALIEAQRIFRRTLAAWTSDLLRLRHRRLDRPRWVPAPRDSVGEALRSCRPPRAPLDGATGRPEGAGRDRAA